MPEQQKESTYPISGKYSNPGKEEYPIPDIDKAIDAVKARQYDRRGKGVDSPVPRGPIALCEPLAPYDPVLLAEHERGNPFHGLSMTRNKPC